MKKLLIALATAFVLLLLAIPIGFGTAYSISPNFRAWVNEFQYRREYVDNETSYTNRKSVEDQARSLLTQYQFNKAEFDNYKDFIGTDDKSREQRALDAKTASNKVVAQYNEYLTKNNYIFKGNLPSDIPYQLEYLGE